MEVVEEEAVIHLTVTVHMEDLTAVPRGPITLEADRVLVVHGSVAVAVADITIAMAQDPVHHDMSTMTHGMIIEIEIESRGTDLVVERVIPVIGIYMCHLPPAVVADLPVGVDPDLDQGVVRIRDPVQVDTAVIVTAVIVVVVVDRGVGVLAHDREVLVLVDPGVGVLVRGVVVDLDPFQGVGVSVGGGIGVDPDRQVNDVVGVDPAVVWRRKKMIMTLVMTTALTRRRMNRPRIKGPLSFLNWSCGRKNRICFNISRRKGFVSRM
jgi:hypothetical protein